MQKGLPLEDDPVWIFLKNNRLAREMIIKPGEQFTAQRVIEKALNQDFGPDPALGMQRLNYKLDSEIDPKQVNRRKYKDLDPELNPSAYYAREQNEMMKRRLIDFESRKCVHSTLRVGINPPTFINKPLTRDQIRKSTAHLLTYSSEYRLRIRK